MGCVEWGADFSIIINVFIQKCTKCSSKRPFRSLTALIKPQSLLAVTSPNVLPQTTEGLILFYHASHLFYFIPPHLYISLLIYLIVCLNEAGATALALLSIYASHGFPVRTGEIYLITLSSTHLFYFSFNQCHPGDLHISPICQGEKVA